MPSCQANVLQSVFSITFALASLPSGIQSQNHSTMSFILSFYFSSDGRIPGFNTIYFKLKRCGTERLKRSIVKFTDWRGQRSGGSVWEGREEVSLEVEVCDLPRMPCRRVWAASTYVFFNTTSTLNLMKADWELTSYK